MKTLIALIAASVFLTGCATNFEKQLDAYKAVELKRSEEGAEKYKALGLIAKDADASTKQVALQAWQAVAMTEQFAGDKQRAAMPAPPPSAVDRAIQVFGIAAPLVAGTMSANYAKQVALNAQNNSAAVALGDQRARVDSLAVVSNGNASIATGGFNALRGQGQDYASAFREALARPTTQVTVNGNSNNTSGRDTTTTTTTTTNTVDCVTTQTNRSGDPASGNGGTNGAGGASTAAGATSTLAKECVAGK